MKQLKHASTSTGSPCAIAARALMLALVAAAPGCAGDESTVRLEGADVLYEGAPYGDLVVLADHVRSCLHSKQTGLPHLILVDQIFECYTPVGWRLVLGCTGGGRTFMVAKAAESSEGQLWSHELTYYYGGDGQHDPCGVLALPGFTLDLPDAGR